MRWTVLVCALIFMSLNTESAETNRIRTLARGAFSGIQEAQHLVITNRAQWTDLWEKHMARNDPKKPAPEVDFSKETVLFVCAGQKRSGGYTIEIRDVREVNGKTEVLVTSKEPKPGGFNISALTAPFQIVAVPRITGEVKFVEAGKKAGG
jgi:hypothetical protein